MDVDIRDNCVGCIESIGLGGDVRYVAGDICLTHFFRKEIFCLSLPRDTSKFQHDLDNEFYVGV